MTLIFYHDDCPYVVSGFASDAEALSWTQHLIHDGALFVDHGGKNILITSEGSRAFRLYQDDAPRFQGARYVTPKSGWAGGGGEAEKAPEALKEASLNLAGDVPASEGGVPVPSHGAARKGGGKGAKAGRKNNPDAEGPPIQGDE